MRDGCARGDDGAHVFVRPFGGFAHRIRDSVGFTDADTHFTVVITCDYCHAELKATAAFDNFCHAGDLDDTLVKNLLKGLVFHHFHKKTSTSSHLS